VEQQGVANKQKLRSRKTKCGDRSSKQQSTRTSSLLILSKYFEGNDASGKKEETIRSLYEIRVVTT
jgi:hypothetical protein